MKSIKISLIPLCIACILAFFGCEKNSQPEAEVREEQVGNIKLAYYTRGSGEPLIMIMGFRGTMAFWDPAFLEAMEKNYTLILFDNRGIGLSTDTEQDETTIAQMAKDTVELIKTLGYDEVNVLGWSMGTRIALDMAINFPDYIKSLILCAPNPGGQYQAKRPSNLTSKLDSIDLPLEEGLSLIFPDTLEGLDASKAFVLRLSKAIIEGTVPNDFKVDSTPIERQALALKTWDASDYLYEKLPTIKIPTLVAGGLSDVIDNPENVRIVANRIPFAWTAYFKGSGHYFLSQNHREFADLVNIFIESTASR
jgi:pimeloyl-ACP methyl ester carboxylesterase